MDIQPVADRPNTATVRCYIGLGANLGEPRAMLQTAAQEIAAIPGVRGLRTSPFYGTAPIDSSGPDYVNAVADIQTSLSAPALLAALQKIEQTHGRKRPYRNAPRTLDLDLLWYGGQTINQSNLTVPHPRMHERAFVLQPLQDLAPDLVLEQGDLPSLLAACADQTIHRLPDPPV